jgi:hypothetical protein
MVIFEVIDLLQRAALLEDLSQVPGDEELRDRHQGVEERTHAHQDQQDLGDLAAEIRRVGIGTDGRDRVQREQEATPQRDVLEQGVGHHPRHLDEDDESGECRQPSQEGLELSALPPIQRQPPPRWRCRRPPGRRR